MVINSYFEIIALCFILFLPFLYETSNKFRYCFKFSLFYGLVILNSIILIPYMIIFRPCDVRNLILASHLIAPVSSTIGLKYDIRGQEHLNKKEACVIVSNHQSSLDVLGMFHMWPIMQKCTVIAKKEIFYIWPFGLAAWLAGLVFINRMNSDEAKATMNNCTDVLIKNKTKLWVFPEGTRRNTGEIHAFKKGAFHVALSSGLPIVPVVFSSYKTFMNKKEMEFKSGNVIIEALPPISTTNLDSKNIDDIMRHVREIMIDVFMSNTKEAKNKYIAIANTVSDAESSSVKISTI